MTGIDSAESPVHSTLLIARGGRFVGLVAFQGNSRIEGEVQGDVLADGRLVVGKSGFVRGGVDADECVIEGRLEGAVRARSRIILRAGAQVRGELAAPSVSIEDGSLFHGRLQMKPAPSSKHG